MTLTARLALPLGQFRLRVEFVTSGDVTGVFGASGAGKTSLLRAISGLNRRARGVIRFGDETWLDSASGVYLPPERRDIGYVPQDGLLFPNRDVRQNLLAGNVRASRNGRPVEETFDTVCRLLELQPLLTRSVDRLSGGERQRVALGRALCSGPKLLLLDEPLASLDRPLRYRVLPFLRRVKEEFRLPMFLVSHDPAEIQAMCDELIVLKRGEVVAQGSVRELLTDPRVVPLTGRDGFENLIPCTRVGGEGHLCEVDLGGRVRLVADGAGGQPGDRVLLSIPAREVELARRQPLETSGENVLRARVRRIQAEGSRRLVTASVAEGRLNLVASASAQVCKNLDLTVGSNVLLVVRPTSCVVHGGSASD